MSASPPSPVAPLERINANRTKVATIRQNVRRRFEEGTDGVGLLAMMSEAIDKFLVELIEESLASYAPAIRDLVTRQLTVIAVGGSGRGEMCPYSDFDVLFLYQPHSQVNDVINAITSQVVRDFWDARVSLGHSVRSLSDAIAMAKIDLQFATSLVEIRPLWGNSDLGEILHRKFQRSVIRYRQSAFMKECVAAREDEFRGNGGAVQQLQPDVKKSAGGLRDLHLLKWVAFARFGTSDLGLLRRQDAISQDELSILQQAHEFLARIRIDLHLAADGPQDILSREEQARIAKSRGFEEQSGQHPAVQFMHQYFQHTTNVSRLVKRFITLQQPRSIWSRIYHFVSRHRANDLFLVGPSEIDVAVKLRGRLCGDLQNLLQLYELAALYRVSLAPDLAQAVSQAAPRLPDLHTPSEARLTLSIFQRSAPLGAILRSMYETGVLEKAIPEFRRTRCLLQFNQYHYYTVDEHTLRAVEAVTSFEHDTTTLGQAYREIHHKEVLHLAVLLHDVGKGGEEDHSEVGRRIAGDVAHRLGLSTQMHEMLCFLVHKHLVMPDLALRRNIADPEVYLPFSREVGSPELLRMLYVLSAADMIAVGPETWTDWKAGFLAELYRRSLEVLSGESVHSHETEQLRKQLQAVHAELQHDLHASAISEAWIDANFATFPANYVLDTSPIELAAVLLLIRGLKDDSIFVRGAYDPETSTVEYRVVARDRIGWGCFSKMAGALTAKRLEIVSARIATSTEGVILDSFRVVDYDFAGAVPETRIDEVSNAIREVLLGKKTVTELFLSNKRHESAQTMVNPMPSRIVIDNDTSDKFTIIEVFAHDRTGLLYVITNTLVQLDLSVCVAKVATHIDQVLDVFYVTDQSGVKLNGDVRLSKIKETLRSRIEAFEKTGTLE